MRPTLLWNAKDIIKLSLKDWLIFNGTIALNRVTGRWRYPVPASGDLETMKRGDAIYWLFKAQYPHRRAVKGSGLEAHFEKQASHRWALPPGFRPAAELSLACAGDLMDHPYLPNSAGVLYEDVRETIFGADLAMANLECPVFMGTAEFRIKYPESPPLYYKRPNFEAARGHRGRNFDFLCTACNHSLDCGEAGVASTIDALRKAGIAFHGVNESESDARRATILEKNGFKIGVVSHTFGLNAKRPPADKPWIVNRERLLLGVAEIDFRQFEAQLRSAREQGADFAVAQLHWGMEHEYYPRPAQLEVARHLAELGFDAIIGHHPHVVQPMEAYRTRRDPDRVVPIHYSLGNLINPFSDPLFRLGAVARLRLAKGTAADGTSRTYVREAAQAEVFQEIDETHQQIRIVRPPNHA